MFFSFFKGSFANQYIYIFEKLKYGFSLCALLAHNFFYDIGNNFTTSRDPVQFKVN